MMLKGRHPIFIDETTESLRNDFIRLISSINTALNLHQDNHDEIVFLMEYKNGRQAILDKEKDVRPEISNKLVINHAQMATRNIVGYFLGTPIQYTNVSADKQEQIDTLNRFVSYEDKAFVDEAIGEYQSICGTAYRMIYTDGDIDEVPFEDKALNPATTLVAYENSIAEKPLFGIYYFDKWDGVNIIGRKVYCYTSFGVYEFLTDESLEVKEEDLIRFTPYDIGGVPIIEYPNNVWRIGDWELQIGLMDYINQLGSSRLDDIDQIIQSFLVFINADIDPDKYDEMRAKGIVMLKNITNMKTEVKNINNTLDQTGVHQFSEQLEKYLYALIGIPDRDNRNGGGGDTGTAVELRDGWADLEIVARTKEHSFKKSEKRSLNIILTILKNKLNLDLSILDIDIKFSRNKNSNLLVKAQGYANLLATKTLAPADCLTIVDLVSDVNEYISRGEAFWGDQFAGKAVETNYNPTNFNGVPQDDSEKSQSEPVSTEE